ncbi:Lactate utilization protein C [Vibrio stylophorae]|uniref:Lactate utilization protein C n=1 Tax=Vibrio stylophorae TaxID=659351 RepID=A0ABN8DS88_9VIBR|nr:lactate utilization protein C [Vibrio stylophorae]CAH0533537.1 Lactate utilization protein C [Vibrio stylophorae]
MSEQSMNPAANQTAIEPGRIQNRDAFIANISQKLGRACPESVAQPVLSSRVHHQVMEDLDQDGLKQVLVEYAQEALGASAITTTKAELSATLKEVCRNYCKDAQGEVQAGETVLSATPELLAMVDVAQLQDEQLSLHVWDPQLGFDANIKIAERAKVGIVLAEQALAESGTMVLYSQAAQGRAVSLLPEASIFIVKKSTLAPRFTQATAPLHQMAKRGERVPSCVNFISGPSSTADIELIKVVGVHGPVFATYVILDDC